MIVDHAGGLHQRIADGRADELESALNQVAAHGVGFGCAGWHLSHSSPTILLRLVADKTPEVSVETAELFPDRENAFAFWIVAAIFNRLRTIPASPRSRFTLRAS